jgi:hypothetical protein
LDSSFGTGSFFSLFNCVGDFVVRGFTNLDYSPTKSGVVSQVNLKIDAENYSITEGGSEKVIGTGGEIKKRTFPIKNRSI